MTEQKRTIPHNTLAVYNCEVPRNPDKFVWVASTIIVSPNRDEILCQKRLKTGEWEFPGGKVEAGENYRDCAVREVKEEVGLDVEIQEYICSVIVGRLDSLFAVQLYLATMLDPDQEIVVDHNAIEEVRWVGYPFARGLGTWLPAIEKSWYEIIGSLDRFATRRALNLQDRPDGGL